MLNQTGCQGVMIGRAAIGNPWIVRDTVHYLRTGEILPPPTFEERAAAAVEHLRDLAAHIGETLAVRHLRGQLPNYVRGLRGASAFRDRIVTANTVAEVETLFATFAATSPESPD